MSQPNHSPNPSRSGPHIQATSATLLERLRDGQDTLAWDQFVKIYWRCLFAFSKAKGCGDATAEDVVQETITQLFHARNVFQYDPTRGKFRNWLFTIADNKIKERRRKDIRMVVSGGENGEFERADADLAPDEKLQRMFEICLLAAMLELVRQEIAPQTFQVFELTAVNSASVADAAAMTGMSRNAVYQARKRVMDRLRELGVAYEREGELTDALRQLVQFTPPPNSERSITRWIEHGGTSEPPAPPPS